MARWKMIDGITAYFEISEAAGLANTDKGEPAKAYIKIAYSFKKPLSTNVAEMAAGKLNKKMLEDTAAFLKTDPKNLRRITRLEYLEGVNEDG